MDVTKQSITILQEHSEPLRKLTTALSADLNRLRLTLSHQDGDSDTEELNLLVGLAELNSSLLAATDMFYQRLHTFLEKGKRGNGLTLEHESK
jgi:hypothetical protein